MFPEGTPDPEYPDENGVRKNKRNPVQEWQAKHQGAHYVWNRTALLQAASDSSVTHLMGLFQPGEMAYELFRDHTTDPSLEEMTEAALRVLSRNPRGFFLFVEGEWQLLADQRRKGQQSGWVWHHSPSTRPSCRRPH